MQGKLDNVSLRVRGVVLPMVLLILVLLGLLAATSSFYVHADLSATQSMAVRLQTRLAAQAGLQKVMLRLREDQFDPRLWYHNPEEYHRVIVWSEEGGEEVFGTTTEFEEEADAPPPTVYRFSIVADDPTDDETLVRYGITDESSKLNINVASRSQLFQLIGGFATEEMNVDELVDALLDWRDSDSDVRQFGAEAQYYAQLDPPYAVKNAAFDTVEELLLVRGFTGELLYGEDLDRNGLISPNEDDGEETWPPDDADGLLRRGLLPYVTVYSMSVNRASDNKPRVNIYGDSNVITQRLRDVVDDQGKIGFIAAASQGEGKLKSPAGLLLPRTERQDNQQGGRNSGGEDNGRGNGRKSNEGGGKGEETQEVPSPLTMDDLGWMMDRLTVSEESERFGLINVNTAPRRVLALLPGLNGEDVEAILTAREEMPVEEMMSTGWVGHVIGREKFIEVAPYITARGVRFHVESIGFADHIGLKTRLEAIVEMRGPIAQIVYNRDITNLGPNFPVEYAEGDPEFAGYRDK